MIVCMLIVNIFVSKMTITFVAIDTVYCITIDMKLLYV